MSEIAAEQLVTRLGRIQADLSRSHLRVRATAPAHTSQSVPLAQPVESPAGPAARRTLRPDLLQRLLLRGGPCIDRFEVEVTRLLSLVRARLRFSSQSTELLVVRCEVSIVERRNSLLLEVEGSRSCNCRVRRPNPAVELGFEGSVLRSSAQIHQDITDEGSMTPMHGPTGGGACSQD